MRLCCGLVSLNTQTTLVLFVVFVVCIVAASVGEQNNTGCDNITDKVNWQHWKCMYVRKKKNTLIHDYKSTL